MTKKISKAETPASDRTDKIEIDELKQATGVGSEHLAWWLANQLSNSLRLGLHADPVEQNNVIKAAVVALSEIAPKDGPESLLAVQMMATHTVAMVCPRRAMVNDQSIIGRDLPKTRR
jgi:hypothetical protein